MREWLKNLSRRASVALLRRLYPNDCAVYLKSGRVLCTPDWKAYR